MAFNNNNTTTTGAHGNVPVGGDHKPTMGEKIGGAVDKLTGKLTKNEAKIAEGEAKQRGDTVGAQQADAAADAHKNTHGATGNHGTTGTHGTHATGVAGTGVGAGHHDNTHSQGTGLTGNNYGTTGTGFTGDHHNTHTTGSGITGGTGLGHKAPGEPTMGDKISGNTQAAAGRMTNDPVQYHQGQERKTDTSYGNAGGLGAGGVGATSAGLGGHGGHTGHGVAGDTYGTTGTGHGLTGSHGDHSHHATGTGAGVGSGVGHNDYNDNNKPSMGEKISGGMDKMVGKATNDPARVMQGEAKSQGHDAYPHSSGTAGGLAGNTTGYGTGTGAHHTGGPGANTGAGAY